MAVVLTGDARQTRPVKPRAVVGDLHTSAKHRAAPHRHEHTEELLLLEQTFHGCKAVAGEVASALVPVVPDAHWPCAGMALALSVAR